MSGTERVETWAHKAEPGAQRVYFTTRFGHYGDLHKWRYRMTIARKLAESGIVRLHVRRKDERTVEHFMVKR